MAYYYLIFSLKNITTMEIVYQTYKEELPEYMAGYTGHIPTVQKEESINQIIHKKHIQDIWDLFQQ